MQSVHRLSGVGAVVAVIASCLVGAPAAHADFDTLSLELRITAVETELQTERTDRISRLGTDTTAAVVQKLRDDLAATKKDLEALRAEVRALSSKPGDPPALTVRAPFVVVDGAGKVLLRVDATAGTNLTAPLAVTAGGQSMLGVTREGITGRSSLTLKSDAGIEFFNVMAGARSSSLSLIADVDGGSVGFGVLKGGSGYLEVNEPEGVTGVRIGAYESNKMGVRVMTRDKIQASLGLDGTSKGILRVGEPTAARGVLGATPSGGISFALYEGAGTDYRVGLLAAPDNSFVRLKSQGNAVHLNADAQGGAVHVFNKGGSAAASLTSTPSGFGKLSLGDANGNTMVEAGTTTDGLGIVRAGPRIGGSGTGGLQGMPFAILGKASKQ